MIEFEVMHLCERQLRDISVKNILNDGLYRTCDCYYNHEGESRGGGYDRFPEIWKKRKGTDSGTLQFVAQLKGCPLRCPYCYVTEDGVRVGRSSSVSVNDMVKAFVESGATIFHLMGGAPALYLSSWNELISALPSGTPFHSDMLLLESEYNMTDLLELEKHDNVLLAISVKGKNWEQFKQNTGVVFDKSLFIRNMRRVITQNIDFYLTFTGMTEEDIEEFRSGLSAEFGTVTVNFIMRDYVSIPIVQYKALQ